jgi:hypothetical protein
MFFQGAGMSKDAADVAMIATGVGLWYVGAKTLADHHDNVSAGIHDDFQSRHAAVIGTVITLAGLGLVAGGVYQYNETAGKVVGAGLGLLMAYNAFKRVPGQPLFPLSVAPIPSPPFGLGHLTGVQSGPAIVGVQSGPAIVGGW